MRDLLRRFLSRQPASSETSGERRGAGEASVAPDAARNAFADLERAVAADPDDAEAAARLGAELVGRGELDRAAALLGRVVSVVPTSASAPAAHRALGVLNAARGDRAAAISHFGEALDRGLRDEAVYRDLCVLLYQNGDPARATDVARRGVAAFPDSSDLHRYLGNLLGLAGDPAEAAASYERALAIGPPDAETHYNLGVVLAKLDRTSDAIASYRRALALEPGRTAAHLNLAGALRNVGRNAEAIVHYSEAARLAPDSIDAMIGEGGTRAAAGDPARGLVVLERARTAAPGDARVHAALGILHADQGRTDDAVRCFEEALRLRPADADTLLRLGNALLPRDQARAIGHYRQALALDPDCGVAHLVTALTGGNAERAPDAYVAKLFDGYADRFDSHLVKELRYETPKLIAGLLREHAAGAGHGWDVLDLGCGTGLLGVEIGGQARSLVGVDLSPGMLAKARETGRYSRLETAELVAMMRGEHASSYDVVTAADVFVYVGRLDDAVREIARLLRPGGHAAFTVESLDALPDASSTPDRDRGYRLNSSGRYAHTLGYLQRLARENAFAAIEVRESPIRLEQGKPVQGYVVLWRRGAPSA